MHGALVAGGTQEGGVVAEVDAADNKGDPPVSQSQADVNRGLFSFLGPGSHFHSVPMLTTADVHTRHKAIISASAVFNARAASDSRQLCRNHSKKNEKKKPKHKKIKYYIKQKEFPHL